MWGGTILEQFGQDLRYAFRTMAANGCYFAAITSLRWNWSQTWRSTASWTNPAALATRGRSRVAGRPELVMPKATKGDFVMKSMSGSTYDEPNSGVTAGIFPFPAFRTFPEERRRLFCCVRPLPILASEEAERKYHKGQADIAAG